MEGGKVQRKGDGQGEPMMRVKGSGVEGWGGKGGREKLSLQWRGSYVMREKKAGNERHWIKKDKRRWMTVK